MSAFAGNGKRETHSLKLLPLNLGSSELSSRMNIDEVYSKVRTTVDSNDRRDARGEQSREAFWRELHQSEDSFAVIAGFFSKGVMQ